ncbi:MAG: GNAT family N-acetyltransferase [Eubacteriales bacterium]|nr:GNAT family N-acetyltransferase [Eubacteriales bacterium]
MIEVRQMQRDRVSELFDMMKTFYQSPALEHPVDDGTLRRTLGDALAGSPGLYGYQLIVDDVLAGFGFVVRYYSTEVGGYTVQFEDLYLLPEYRGHGVGTSYFKTVMQMFPEARRFRLEVTEGNTDARRLYERLGFRHLGYTQMIYDVPTK